MESFVLLEGTDTLKDSRELLNNALLSVRSLSSGTAFPTDNLSAGMLCYRTDLKKLYQYKEDGSWTTDVSMSVSGNANTANSAGTAKNAEHADTAEHANTADSADTADSANTCTGNSATATKLLTPRTINAVSFDGSKNIEIPVGVKTVNGLSPDASGDVTVAGVPIGFEYLSFNPNIPVGSLPLLGGTYSRSAYADLWEWVQEQEGYLITEAEWQAKSTANGGNVPFYSSGDGSTTFRVPSLSCWVKGANGIEEVGSYLEAGLPNITGTGIWGKSTETPASGAVYTNGGNNYGGTSSNSAASYNEFDASLSNPIYGASDTVQPPSVVGIWLVKAFGTVSNVGNQDLADISEAMTDIEMKMSDYTNNVAYIDSFVVETYVNGTEWYRVYSNGWVEQGGYVTGSGYNTVTVNLLKPMANADYLALSVAGSGQKVGDSTNSAFNLTTTTFQSYQHGAHRWYVCGMGET